MIPIRIKCCDCHSHHLHHLHHRHLRHLLQSLSFPPYSDLSNLERRQSRTRPLQVWTKVGLISTKLQRNRANVENLRSGSSFGGATQHQFQTEIQAFFATTWTQLASKVNFSGRFSNLHLAGSDNDPAGLNAEVVEAIRQGSYRLRPVVQRRIDRRDQKRWCHVPWLLILPLFDKADFKNWHLPQGPLRCLHPCQESLHGLWWRWRWRWVEEKNCGQIRSSDFIQAENITVELAPHFHPRAWRLMML